MERTKVCIKCSESKTLDNYHKDSTMRDGFRSDCKNCCKIKRQKNYLKNKDSQLELNRLWKQAHPNYQKEWHLKHPTYQHDRLQKIKSLY
jgi:hypothetical protein